MQKPNYITMWHPKTDEEIGIARHVDVFKYYKKLGFVALTAANHNRSLTVFAGGRNDCMRELRKPNLPQWYVDGLNDRIEELEK